MTEALATNDAAADEFCEDCGYEPELKRTLNGFQVFAISFASLSVAVGIFATYDDVLRDSGPIGIWLFPPRGDRTDPGGIGVRAIRRPHTAERLLVRVGVAAGQPESRLGLWLAGRDQRPRQSGDDRQCVGQSVSDATARYQPNENTARLITVIVLVIQACPRHRRDTHRRLGQLVVGGRRTRHLVGDRCRLDRRNLGDGAMVHRQTCFLAVLLRATPTSSSSAAV